MLYIFYRKLRFWILISSDLNNFLCKQEKGVLKPGYILESIVVTETFPSIHNTIYTLHYSKNTIRYC